MRTIPWLLASENASYLHSNIGVCMDYLVHAHDPTAVRAGNILEGLGGIRHIAGLQTSPTRDLIALFSSESPFLEKRFLRRVRPDNEEILGIIVPSWARGAYEVIALNPLRAQRLGFEDAICQLHSRLTRMPLPHKQRRRRHRSSRRASYALGG